MRQLRFSDWPKWAVILVGAAFGILGILLVAVGMFTSMDEPFANVEHYAAHALTTFFALLGPVCVLWVFTVGLTAFGLQAVGDEPWRPLCRVSIAMLLPACAWSFCCFCAATGDPNFSLATPPPSWMTWSGFRFIGSFWVLVLMAVTAIGWWAWLLKQQPRGRVNPSHV